MELEKLTQRERWDQNEEPWYKLRAVGGLQQGNIAGLCYTTTNASMPSSSYSVTDFVK